MDGYIIEYEPFGHSERMNFNYTLYGRLNQKKDMKNVIYYKKGMLDKTQYKKLDGKRVFVRSLDDVSIEQLRIFADVSVSPASLDISEEELTTGEEYWMGIAKKRGLNVRYLREPVKRD